MAQGKEFTQEEQARIIEATLENLRHGSPEYKAAADAGASYPTWFRWREQMPGLTERVREAKRGRVPLLEDSLYKMALKGSVNACLILLRKESKEWRELIDGTIAPRNPDITALGEAAVAGAAAVINMLSQEKRMRVKAAMARENLLVLPPPYLNGNGANGTNGNGNGTGH